MYDGRIAVTNRQLALNEFVLGKRVFLVSAPGFRPMVRCAARRHPVEFPRTRAVGRLRNFLGNRRGVAVFAELL
jgi:hypothetical protein